MKHALGRDFNGTEVFKAICETLLKLKQHFGINYVCLILIGSESAKILSHKHQELSEHGALKAYSFEQVKAMVEELSDLGLLERTTGQYPLLQITKAGREVFESGQEVLLKAPDPTLARKSLLSKGETVAKTLEMFRQGKTVTEIAQERELSQLTIIGHLATAYEMGESVDIDQFIPSSKVASISAAFEKYGTEFLSPVKRDLGNGVTWTDLQLVRAKLLRQEQTTI